MLLSFKKKENKRKQTQEVGMYVYITNGNVLVITLICYTGKTILPKTKRKESINRNSKQNNFVACHILIIAL